MPIPRPDTTEYADFHATYVSKVPEGDPLAIAKSQAEEYAKLIGNADESVGDVVHPPYAWTVKQVLSHVNDAERVFGYRTLRFAVGDETPVPGFEQDSYVANTDLGGTSLADLHTEFQQLRAANLSLFERLPEAAYRRTGTADGNPISVRALVYITLGHAEHHLRILRERLA